MIFIKILFVCTGNTCRSPMAQALCEKLGQDRGIRLECDSAGVAAVNGSPMAENAKKVLCRFGIRDFDHRAKRLLLEDLESADLILTVTEHHALFLTEAFGHKEKILPLPGQVGDPFGGDEETYQRAADAIWAGLEALADRGLFHD